jgi:hypothetical protein
MDENFYELNLLYLMMIRGMILAGQEQKAMFCFGLTPEATTILKKMRVNKIQELARDELFVFSPRFPVNSWRTYLTDDQKASDPNEQRARELRMLLPTSGNKTE